MHIRISTRVNQSYQNVFAGFNQKLFEKLMPPFPPIKLLRFDGSKKGDIVEVELHFIFFRQPWTSLIVADGISETEAYFIDEGIRLPFFLSYWRHHHRIVKAGKHARIIDDIHFSTPFRLLDYLLYPAMWLQFVYRKPVYKKLFR